MRKIKFRAWDKENNKMIYSNEAYPRSSYKFEFDIVNNFEFTLSKIIDRFNVKDEEGEDYFIDCYGKVDAEIMQYTGLEDGNGKEIYEGDIVDIGNGKRFTVGWHKYNQEFTFLNVNNNYFEKTYRGASRDTWKVIGNIYENKDLLK